MPRKCHEFTDEEINYIIENWGKESPHSMKKKFGCTWYAITKVAENNGLVLPTSNEWTEEEIDLLKDTVIARFCAPAVGGVSGCGDAEGPVAGALGAT